MEIKNFLTDIEDSPIKKTSSLVENKRESFRFLDDAEGGLLEKIELVGMSNQ